MYQWYSIIDTWYVYDTQHRREVKWIWPPPDIAMPINHINLLNLFLLYSDLDFHKHQRISFICREKYVWQVGCKRWKSWIMNHPNSCYMIDTIYNLYWLKFYQNVKYVKKDIVGKRLATGGKAASWIIHAVSMQPCIQFFTIDRIWHFTFAHFSRFTWDKHHRLWYDLAVPAW